MNTTIRTPVIAAMMLSCFAGFCGGQEPSGERPYIGVLMEPLPCREILAEHLGLARDQGLIIKNVQSSSPANKAGLKRNDIIFAFDEKPLSSPEQFVDAVEGAGVGTQISLDVIHQGQRRRVNVIPEPYKGNDEWEYPFEDRPPIEFFSPGMMLKRKPGDEAWQEFSFHGRPREVYTFSYTKDGDTTVVTIEGNPQDPGAAVTVTAGDDTQRTMAGDIDKLPEPFVPLARESLEKARRMSKEKAHSSDARSESYIMKRFGDLPDMLNRQLQPVQPPIIIRPEDRDRMQKRIDELEQRLERLEQERPRREEGV